MTFSKCLTDQLKILIIVSFFCCSPKETKVLAKIVYDKRSMRTQTIGLKYFSLQSGQKPDKLDYDFNVYTVDFAENTQSMWITNALIPRNQFVIERLPAGSKVNCYDTDPSYLQPHQCNGDLRMRRRTDDD